MLVPIPKEARGRGWIPEARATGSCQFYDLSGDLRFLLL